MKSMLWLFIIILGAAYADAKVVVAPPGIVPYAEHERRLTSAPYLSGDTFRAIANFIFDDTRVSFDTDDVFEGAIVFLYTEYIPYFYAEVMPHIKARFILVSSNSDYAFYPDHIADSFTRVNFPLITMLQDDKIIAWFAQNAAFDHEKLQRIPIGIANIFWPHGNTALLDAQRVEVANNAVKKDILLYCNFSLWTNPKARHHALNSFSTKDFCYFAKDRNYHDFLHDIARSYFVLSPPGNGLDCVRTWESCYLNAIPIMLSSPLDALYKDLPVLIIHDWSEVTREFLAQKYYEMQAKTYKLEKLFAPYYIDQIIALQRSIILK